MEERIEAILKEFKIATLSIIEKFRTDDFDSIDLLFKLREEYIEALKKMDYEKQEFAKVYKRLEISSLEEKLNEVIKNKSLKVKQNINKLSKNTMARKNYNKTLTVDSIYFNKKI